MADANAFTFQVPQCEPGVSLKVPAPDGVTLKIPLPPSILPGDQILMGKGADGNWTVTKVLRGVAPETQWRSPEQMAAECQSAEAVKVRLDTTKGPIFISVVPSWAPIGAQRFLQLIDDGYFADIAIYRAIDRGLIQFGVVQSTDKRSTQYSKLPDDKLVGIPYAEGIVGFAAAGPGTRKSTVCIMKADFRTQLGKGELGTPSTETPFGMVCPESMATMHLITCLGDIPQCGGAGPDPVKLETMGNAYIRSEFPSCDFITGAARA
eukprot:CAMPEP_0176059782 /NCGR_PEP_ID=MMETSP0120_2-20121206/29793_1 /TAXON_ID=160619 /ORGANISM="Kryptoperidinium foliaceum, Strain CCMP 1326" /LENGTH=264 /DNA_ID=CAMNT_0017393319 /DNA_START=57 /DNA_END=851 /DNA_ORIENTATION=+